MKQNFSMEWPFVKALLWGLFVFLQIHQHTGCFQEERLALLELKAFLQSNINYADLRLLPSWIDDTKSECCGWERVTCNSTTAHVIKLSIDNMMQYPFFYQDSKELKLSEEYDDNNYWLLNVSLFLPFKELTTLNLSANTIGGCLPNEGFEKLSSLRNLRILNLGYNYFDNNSILQSLGAVMSLETLILTQNNLEGYFPAQELMELKNLNELDISRNKYNGSLRLQGFESLSRLENLETLDLSDNYFDIRIIESLSAVKSLKNLNLASNSINGSFPAQGFESLSRLENLETLDLSDNYFDIRIIESLSAVKTLKNLNLTRNYIEGLFPVQGLSNFSRLEILDLSRNSFSGSISPSIGAVLSSLKAISLANNQLNGTLPKELCALKKLEELDLYDNLFEGILPPCLKNLTSLRFLDISQNQFTGNISSSLIAIPTSLGYIDLSSNNFEGLFSFSLFANHSKLEVFILMSENNKLEIETENSAGWDFSFQLKVLVLPNCNLNKFTGNIPEFLFDQRKLEIIDLPHNQLKGGFPIWLLENNTRLQQLNLRNNSFVGKFHLPPNRYRSIFVMDVSDNYLDGKLQENFGKITPHLGYLNLSRNHFEGYLPPSIGDMTELVLLDLSFNNFSGELPTELFTNCSSLDVLKLCNNQFIGTIPRLIENMTSLSTFLVSNNSFEGQIPCGPDSLKLVDLSHNSFSGSLPSCLNLYNVEHLRLQGNKLTRPIPKSVLYSPSLLTLDLRDNNFFGSIPNELGALSNLRILLLRGNNFSDIIPNQLCWLRKIGIMDLSKNSLSGTIPYCFQSMSFGKIDVQDLVYTEYPYMSVPLQVGSTFQRLLEWDVQRDNLKIIEYGEQIRLEFVTKYMSNSYGGNFLDYMSGLDLSCNKLTGKIPPELGDLSSIHTLNLSYNQLTGSISPKFSNLAQLESLDLSHNNLSGEIPSVLIDLTFLAVFTVAYNNLSGKVPDWKAQFATFEKSSYEGNPFLCGQPLENNCTRIDESHPSPTNSSNASKGKWYEVDHQVFSASFTASYVIFFLGAATLLYIHPYWQQRYFNLIEDFKYRCYYPIFDTLKRLSNHLYP